VPAFSFKGEDRIAGRSDVKFVVLLKQFAVPHILSIARPASLTSLSIEIWLTPHHHPFSFQEQASP
jgi:hypothetical protein